MTEEKYNLEYMHSSPCEYTRNSMTLIKWCLGLIVTLGVFGIGVALQSSEKAKDKADNAVDIAIEAKDKTAKIEVLAADVRNIKQDVQELKELRAMLNQISRDVSTVMATQEGIKAAQESANVKLNYLGRSDNDG